eukprot:gene8122-8316_t
MCAVLLVASVCRWIARQLPEVYTSGSHSVSNYLLSEWQVWTGRWLMQLPAGTSWAQGSHSSLWAAEEAGQQLAADCPNEPQAQQSSPSWWPESVPTMASHETSEAAPPSNLHRTGKEQQTHQPQLLGHQEAAEGGPPPDNISILAALAAAQDGFADPAHPNQATDNGTVFDLKELRAAAAPETPLQYRADKLSAVFKEKAQSALEVQLLQQTMLRRQRQQEAEVASLSKQLEDSSTCLESTQQQLAEALAAMRDRDTQAAELCKELMIIKAELLAREQHPDEGFNLSHRVLPLEEEPEAAEKPVVHQDKELHGATVEATGRGATTSSTGFEAGKHSPRGVAFGRCTVQRPLSRSCSGISATKQQSPLHSSGGGSPSGRPAVPSGSPVAKRLAGAADLPSKSPRSGRRSSSLNYKAAVVCNIKGAHITPRPAAELAGSPAKASDATADEGVV